MDPQGSVEESQIELVLMMKIHSPQPHWFRFVTFCFSL